MKKYECEPCGYIYDPAVGDPDGGIAPGTAFEDIPDDWVCPICGMGKEVFCTGRRVTYTPGRIVSYTKKLSVTSHKNTKRFQKNIISEMEARL